MGVPVWVWLRPRVQAMPHRAAACSDVLRRALRFCIIKELMGGGLTDSFAGVIIWDLLKGLHNMTVQVTGIIKDGGLIKVICSGLH